MAAEHEPAPGKIILHIGRNKAASTTLQEFFARHQDALGRAGFDYFLMGHLKDSDPRVRGLAHQLELAAEARTRPGRTLLASNEMMSAWPDDFTRIVGAALSEFDVKVLVYIRPYASWMVSQYAQMTRMGANARDFDAFFDGYLPKASAWPNVSVWAEAFGWKNLYVRALDPRFLVGGDVVADCVATLGLSGALPNKADFTPQNESPHWACSELFRAVIDPGAGPTVGKNPLTDFLEPIMMKAISLHSPPAAQYLRPDQARALDALYNRDMARFGAEVGCAFPLASHDGMAPRPFMPSLAMVAKNTRAAFVSLLEEAAPADADQATLAARARAVASFDF